MVLTLLAVVQAAALLLLLLRLLPGRRRRPPVPPLESIDPAVGDVSIIVATLQELVAQGPIVREILVVDSGSTDGTGALVEQAAARDPRIRLLYDPPLRAGWIGKVWALEYGLRAASGTWVLGLDADTVPHAGLAAGAVRAAVTSRYDAVSFSPRFRMMTAAERWLQPALLVTLVYRFGAAGTDVDPERVMANGQCFLARRATLLAAGGYSSARASFCDDVTLARHLARRGHRVGFLDGSRLYDVRSYSSARETWREWGRSLDLKDATSAARLWSDVLFLAIVQGTPVPVLASVALIASLGGASRVSGAMPLVATSLALLAVRMMLQHALAGSYERRGLPFWLSPLADPLAALRIALSSARRPTHWRGRDYLPEAIFRPS
jgi:dolichol-phosphate mannosyltransferase